ncbi:4866_t:CDS:1, partial [Paraglomus occultum]
HNNKNVLAMSQLHAEILPSNRTPQPYYKSQLEFKQIPHPTSHLRRQIS